MTERRYPAGEYSRPTDISASALQPLMSELEAFPELLKEKTSHLSKDQFNTKTLPGVWTISQVINHLADSHINAFCRIKLALTEDKPSIKAYEEGEWANLPDGLASPPNDSMILLSALHCRWVLLLRSLDDDQLKREFIHPGYGRIFSVGEVVGLYAWHGKHHLGHIEELIQSRGWI